MEKTNLVIAKIKAVKGYQKGKNNRLKYYIERSNDIEKVDIEYINNFDFEKEVIKWDNDIRAFELKRKRKKY
jgi:hypothetical protein